MVKARGSYPHPVIDASDDVDSEFRMANVEKASRVDSFELYFDVFLDDDEIKEYLEDRTARMVMRWRCRQTMRIGYEEPRRDPSRASGRRWLVSLPHSDISGPIQMELQIIAAAPIDDYQLRNQNPDYGQARFRIQPGDVLAVGGSVNVLPDKAYDPMNPPIESCFEIMPSEEVAEGIKLLFHDDQKVIVLVNHETAEKMRHLPGRTEYLTATVMLPALVGALDYMKYEAGEGDFLGDNLWYRALENLLSTHKVEHEPPLVQAQRILHDPIGRSVAKEHSILEEEEE